MKIKFFNLAVGQQLFKALGDASRLRILNLLQVYGQVSSHDLEQVLEFSQTKTSRHLNYLKTNQLISSQRRDQYVFHGLNDQLADVLAALLAPMKNDEVLQKDIEHYRVMYSNRVLAINRLERKKYMGH